MYVHIQFKMNIFFLPKLKKKKLVDIQSQNSSYVQNSNANPIEASCSKIMTNKSKQ